MANKNTIYIHKLDGCQSKPLAHYLKALAILRLIGEQCDDKARGWWQEDVFHVACQLDREMLENFFLFEYRPTPMLAPWNGGSGFYPKDNKSGIDPIRFSTAPRLDEYRLAILLAQSCVADLTKKPNKGEQKNHVIAGCRRLWRGQAGRWIDAALALGVDGEPAFPAMLGTGGNDGRLDFTSNFMQRLVSLFDMVHADAIPFPETHDQLSVALWSEPSPTLESGAVGQFLPNAAGGPNGTNGFAGNVRVNPWDYVFMLEGAVAFVSGLSRRCQADRLPQASAPFAVRSSGCGYGSSDSSDAGPRGEQWMPMWDQPASARELANVLREGRSHIHRKPAGQGTDMARAVARMGTARGISSFERYGYIERNGLSNLAVPLGRFEVVARENQRLIDRVAHWLDHYRRMAGDKNAPVSITRAFRACEEAIIGCTRDARGSAFLSLLIALGQAEDQLLASPKFAAKKCARPLPLLDAKWLDVARENSPEWRLALALAAQQGPLGSKAAKQVREWQSVRAHWLPLDGGRFAKSESGLCIGPEQAAIGCDLERALLAVMDRRLKAMVRVAGDGVIPLRLCGFQYGAELEHIERFLNGDVDDGRILAIARGLMSVKFGLEKQWNADSNSNGTSLGGMALYGVLRLALPTRKVWLPDLGDVHVCCNSSLFARLRSGDLESAVQLATRQLTAAGLRPRLHIGFGSQQFARRLAASMAFGLSPSEWTRLALGLTNPVFGVASEQT